MCDNTQQFYRQLAAAGTVHWPDDGKRQEAAVLQHVTFLKPGSHRQAESNSPKQWAWG